jgi:hypothetical protein
VLVASIAIPTQDVSLSIDKSGGYTVRQLLNRWRGFWKDFNSKEDWRFPELPPVQLQKSFDGLWTRVDRGELLRAEWMWYRKPKLVLGEGGFAYALLVFVALLLLLIPQAGPPLAIIWCSAMLSAIAREVVRSTRWRREYEVSITRIMRSFRNLK